MVPLLALLSVEALETALPARLIFELAPVLVRRRKGAVSASCCNASFSKSIILLLRTDPDGSFISSFSFFNWSADLSSICCTVSSSSVGGFLKTAGGTFLVMLLFVVALSSEITL